VNVIYTIEDPQSLVGYSVLVVSADDAKDADSVINYQLRTLGRADLAARFEAGEGERQVPLGKVVYHLVGAKREESVVEKTWRKRRERQEKEDLFTKREESLRAERSQKLKETSRGLHERFQQLTREFEHLSYYYDSDEKESPEGHFEVSFNDQLVFKATPVIEQRNTVVRPYVRLEKVSQGPTFPHLVPYDEIDDGLAEWIQPWLDQ